MSNTQFEKTSFWNLLSGENITIPIIQRAYTQGGRGGDPKIEIKSDRFLKRLIEALKGKPITLDFVYGSNSGNKVFPLDGQQRLTTLFLLHWYIAQKEDKLSEDNVKETLKKFSYETRLSSRYFCEHLCEYTVEDRKESLRDTIKNQKWYMLAWEEDPSVASMLEMLDKIDKSLLNNDHDSDTRYWDALTKNVENCPITFFYASLENLDLTDDLYIKMNARGLELTDFEKFKSSFNQKIEDNGWDKDRKNIAETFGHKIDTVWTNLFWEYRDEDGLIDNNLVHFIAAIAINRYAQFQEILENKEDEEIIKQELGKEGKNITEYAIKKRRIEKRIASLANNSHDVNPDDFPNKDAFDYLVNCLDKYAENGNSKVKPNIDTWGYSKTSFFEDMIRQDEIMISQDKITYPKRVLFYAQTAYLLNHSFQSDSFNDWMRVVRNIVHNVMIDSADPFMGAITLVKELAEGSKNIYHYLHNNPAIQSKFANDQVQEEIRKAVIIIEKPDFKNIIHGIEDTAFCKGSILWTFKCVDLEEKTALQKLNKIKNIITKHLNEDDISDLFRRALLTIGDNKFYEYRFGRSNTTNTKRRCLIENIKDLKEKFVKPDLINFKNYFKPLIMELIDNSIEDIINNYVCPENMPNWKKRLIQEKSLLDEYCRKHYFGIDENNEEICFLYKDKKTPSSRDECHLVE
jgi:hypothetical protein